MGKKQKTGGINATAANKGGYDVLPVPDIPRPGTVYYDAKDPDAKFPPLELVKPPKGAPNVLVVLIDDVGFGAASAFGGPCNTPVAERLAAAGLKYTRFHTTALCSPTRAALLTGRNHHAVGMGSITETATSAPGYTGVRPNSCATYPDILRMNGYNTAHFGKCHEVPAWETSPIGPFDRWPNGNGYQHFYGFIAGETHQFYPALFENTTPVEPWGLPEDGYHLTEDLADKCIGWIKQQRALAPDRPFLVYFAPGATHAPHHVPPNWIDRYKGKFDHGWDKVREETLERQKKLGVIPQDAVLTPRPAEIPAWDDMDDKLKPVLARQMEIYAAFLEHTDHHVGQIIDTLEQLGELENTLVYYIIGDNGASAEGSVQGTFNEMLAPNGATEDPEFMIERLEKFGGPESYNHYAVGWAHALNTPYQWTKQVASHWGGTRNGTIVHWPKGIEDKGGIRHQFCHVTDVAPTILEAAGIKEPKQVHGVTQQCFHGVSMVYSFDDAGATEKHQTQYFEMFGNRGIYHKGWSAVTKHRTPWDFYGQPPAFDDDVWELYDGNTDWTQSRDLAKERPEKLAELQRQFLFEATKYNVLPLDDRNAERLNPDIAGRPTLVHGTSQVFFEGMGRLNENSVINVLNKSHRVTALLEVPEGSANGVIINQGGIPGGWALYVKNRRLRYAYNHVGVTETIIAADAPIPAGEHNVSVDFKYDGGGLGKGAAIALYVDGKEVASGRVEQTHIVNFTLDETTDVGKDTGSPVTSDYRVGDNAFTGRVKIVKIDIGDDDHSHMIDKNILFQLAMSKQ
ncbi:arylsulfatase [Sandaracinobacter sp. RS1-74]|uniref:arylsulfatase n=1 Tax=Sandaracinobacteroides sayramensis TaxID=2913411 RepID=UPI001EDB0083|nr:arylsulfatase [Sandaracinobacteroides sayramensis]MCG2840562.1 arylsulfatase [Sandaracinobacteroides sayramensis]